MKNAHDAEYPDSIGDECRGVFAQYGRFTQVQITIG